MDKSYWPVILAVIIVAGLFIGGVLSCTRQINDQFYAAEHDCVSNGGTWMPTTGYSAACAAPHGK